MQTKIKPNIGAKEESLRLSAEWLGKDDNVIFALVFGSFSKGRHKADSDLDIAVFFKTPPEGLDLLFYRSHLSEKAGKEVDLAVLNRASAFLRHQVMKYGLLLLTKDQSVYGRFREKTIFDYQEYQFLSGMHVYDR
ncbi:MAG: nucleotidyltransferase domain-containing protein [Thermodesulfobacteriota bacterium]